MLLDVHIFSSSTGDAHGHVYLAMLQTHGSLLLEIELPTLICVSTSHSSSVLHHRQRMNARLRMTHGLFMSLIGRLNLVLGCLELIL